MTSVRDGNILFRNDGHGHFTNITAEAGVAGNAGHSSGAVFFDYDGDGLLDLFVTNVSMCTRPERRPNGLYASFGDAFAGHLHPERYKHRSGTTTWVTANSNSRSRGRRVWLTGPGRAKRRRSISTATDAGSVRARDARAQPALSQSGWRSIPEHRTHGISRNAVGCDGCEGARLERRRPVRFVRHRHAYRHVLGSSARGRTQETRSEDDVPATLPCDGWNHVLGNALFTNQGQGRFSEMSDQATRKADGRGDRASET